MVMPVRHSRGSACLSHFSHMILLHPTCFTNAAAPAATFNHSQLEAHGISAALCLQWLAS